MRISRERNRRRVAAGACLISLTAILTKKKKCSDKHFFDFSVFFAPPRRAGTRKEGARGSDAENFSGNVEFQFVSARRAPLNKRHAFSENFPAVAERAFLRGMRRRRARGAARDGDGGDVPAV